MTISKRTDPTEILRPTPGEFGWSLRHCNCLDIAASAVEQVVEASFRALSLASHGVQAFAPENGNYMPMAPPQTAIRCELRSYKFEFRQLAPHQSRSKDFGAERFPGCKYANGDSLTIAVDKDVKATGSESSFLVTLIISWMEETRSSFSSTLRLDREDPYLRLLCVNIFVRNQDRSLRFYVEQLGFGLVIDESYESGGRWVAVAPPDGNTVLALVTPKRNSEEYKLIGRCRHAVLVTEDVFAKYEEWQQHGVRFHHPPQMTLWGGMFTRFEDLDGNSFVLAGRDDFVREIEAERRAAADRLEAERRTAQELEIAKQVQARLFPQKVPQLKTLDYAGVCIQARDVGGDYYDFLSLGEERLGLIIGDTSGKGIGAALLMANLQANVRSQSAVALDHPQRFLQSVNQLFYENTTESAYATLFLAEYNDQRRSVRYVNCGHYSPLLLRADHTLEQLTSTSTVLGLFPNWSCDVAERQLRPGDILALYTDGIIEAFNEEGDEFGEQRLIEGLRQNGERSAEAIIGAIIGEVRRFSSREQHDDITLIVAKCR